MAPPWRRSLWLSLVLPHAPLADAAQPAVRKLLVDELFLGQDPLEAPAGAAVLAALGPDEQMTHVSPRDIDAVLELAPQPVSFWLELGAFEGGSAILAGRRAAARAGAAGASETCVVAVDTFLGDLRVLWEQPPDKRRQLLRPDGTVSLYERFRANVQRAGQANAVLPLPATSVVALRLFASLAERGVAPRPQVIYLDSAHEEGEVLLELDLAWRAIAPGGIIFGDDWVLPEGRAADRVEGSVEDGGAVQRDVLRFAEAHGRELDDTLGKRAWPTRTLGRARPGLFVSYLSFQWFLRKLPDAELPPDATVPPSRAAAAVPAASAAAAFDCWSDGYEEGDCCDVQRFGSGGNPKCWDLVFTFARCCVSR
mmetsp:Transcript_104835/g.333610  ORF Transcript_104835/g.333610 Transcript_104835/m.333610 type:complete len:368 (-) Transcript_104835:78-1181(-)